MGGSSYSDDHYTARVADRVARGVPTFDHDAKVKSGAAPAKAHDLLSPKGVTRESRDSDAHPNSVAIGVIFDVTGSMGGVPKRLQAKIPNLMGLLLRKGYVEDPQILFGAVGDYFSDKVPLQIGQFESGIEMDDDITKLVLEGGGGGGKQESYQNALYFFARHTSIDCFEKRGKKGYLFIIGDEKPYAESRADELLAIFGDTVQASISTEALVAECQEKYEVFFVIPNETSYFAEPWLKERWTKLLGGEHVIMLKDPDAVCESIGLAIGLIEGTTDLHDAKSGLHADGASASIVSSVGDALGPLASKTALARTGAATGDLPATTSSPAGTARI